MLPNNVTFPYKDRWSYVTNEIIIQITHWVNILLYGGSEHDQK